MHVLSVCMNGSITAGVFESEGEEYNGSATIANGGSIKVVPVSKQNNVPHTYKILCLNICFINIFSHIGKIVTISIQQLANLKCFGKELHLYSSAFLG